MDYPQLQASTVGIQQEEEEEEEEEEFLGGGIYYNGRAKRGTGKESATQAPPLSSRVLRCAEAPAAVGRNRCKATYPEQGRASSSFLKNNIRHRHSPPAPCDGKP